MLRSLLQILAETHRDVKFRRLCPRPDEMAILVHHETERTGKVSFQSGNVHLAVALRRVAVTRLKQRTLYRDGNVQDAPRHEFLVVHIAGMRKRRRTIDLAARRLTAHAAEERVQRELDARSELPDHSLAVEGNDLRAAVGILHR